MIFIIKEKGKEGEYGENPAKFHDPKKNSQNRTIVIVIVIYLHSINPD